MTVRTEGTGDQQVEPGFTSGTHRDTQLVTGEGLIVIVTTYLTTVRIDTPQVTGLYGGSGYATYPVLVSWIVFSSSSERGNPVLLT